MILQNQYLLGHLRDPQDGSAYSKLEGDRLQFAGGNSYPILRDVPILINEQNSVFSIQDIVTNVQTTQSAAYANSKHWKNYIRQRILPSLTQDTSYEKRYSDLATRVTGGVILILGAGNKADFYRKIFSKSELVISDVHCQFQTDMVLDAHNIPFSDNFFSLVIAEQVLEHVSRPWVVAAEIQRVTKMGGYIQIGVPFVFPYHSPPYDFYRFTPSALRFLFPKCRIETLETPEGNFSGAAVAVSNAFISSFRNRFARMAVLTLTRLFFGWMKYADRLLKFKHDHNSMPKGFAVTYTFDGEQRDEKQLLKEVKELLGE